MGVNKKYGAKVRGLCVKEHNRNLVDNDYCSTVVVMRQARHQRTYRTFKNHTA
jgi:hypothetical protein